MAMTKQVKWCLKNTPVKIEIEIWLNLKGQIFTIFYLFFLNFFFIQKELHYASEASNNLFQFFLSQKIQKVTQLISNFFHKIITLKIWIFMPKCLL